MGVDEIIRMAEEADDYADSVIQMPGEYHPDWHTVRDERFAALVTEATKAQPQGEPVAEVMFTDERTKPDVEWLVDEVRNGTLLYAAPPVVPQGEPVAWMSRLGNVLTAKYMEKYAAGIEKETHTIPLYTTPPSVEAAAIRGLK